MLAIKSGDKIITSGGIIGSIVKVADNRELTVEVAEMLKLKLRQVWLQIL